MKKLYIGMDVHKAESEAINNLAKVGRQEISSAGIGCSICG
jgi:hypothetical protein